MHQYFDHFARCGVDLLLIVDHMSVPCGVRTTYLKFIEWCADHQITIALISDTTEDLPYSSIKKRVCIKVHDEPRIRQVKRRPLLSLIDDDAQVIHCDLIGDSFNYRDAWTLDAWNGDRTWLDSVQEEVTQFLHQISPKRVLIATQSFLGFASFPILRGYDVSVCLHTNYPATYAIRIAGEENHLFYLIQSEIRARLYSYFIQQSSKMFLVSETSRRFFPSNESAEYHIFSPGVDTKLFKPAKLVTAGTLRIIYVGRLTREKGVDELLELSDLLPDIWWTFVGELPDEQRPKWRPNVTLMGALDQASLSRELGRSDLFIFQGKWDTFGLVALEALSCGVIVLALAGTEIATVVTQNHCGNSYSSIAELMKLIDYYEKDHKALVDRKRNARHFAEQMSWDNSFKSFADILGIRRGFYSGVRLQERVV